MNVGFAALTMNKDIGLSATAFGLGGGLFFIGYFIFGVPSNYMLERIGARRWMAILMVGWGIASMGMSLVQAGFLLSMVQTAGMLLGVLVGLGADRLGLRRCMLMGVMADAVLWPALQGLDSISVNVTPEELMSEELLLMMEELRAGLAKAPPLVLEVTETAAMDDELLGGEVAARLHLHGLELAIDDFGVGFSSLARLQMLPVSELQQFDVKAHEILKRDAPWGYSDRFLALMKFQAERAHRIYDEAMALLPEADRKAQKPGLMMANIYRTLLREIEAENFQVLHQRIALTPLRKLWIAMKTNWRGR